MTAPIEIILATAAHEAGFMALQAANLVANIPMAHHASGFVTTPFTSEQYATLVNERYLMVAMAEDQLIGYVVSASWDFLQHYPIFAYMIELLPSLSLDGVMMSEHHSYQYGPVCIDAAWRGKNLLPHMFDEAKTHMSSAYT
ncbi:MAG: GNAT family acetyltransferase [Alphaproteobacteria bacterium]|nr:MAG: GNAT family acetyltransferase [Alphaproteobacteria bacterium]